MTIGLVEIAGGVAMTYSTGGVVVGAGWYFVGVGIDEVIAGLREYSGQQGVRSGLENALDTVTGNQNVTDAVWFTTDVGADLTAGYKVAVKQLGEGAAERGGKKTAEITVEKTTKAGDNAIAAPGAVSNFSDKLSVSAQAARRHLRRNVPGTGGQAHHIIPFETRSHELVQRAARGGFNMNGANNGIRLDLTQHLGSHPRYNAAVTRKLDDILRANPGISDIDAANALQRYTDQLRAGLERSTSMLH